MHDLREIVAKAAWDAYYGYITSIPWDELKLLHRKEGHYRIADAVLAAIDANGGMGLTAEEVEALADSVRDSAYLITRTAHPQEDHRRLAVARSAIAKLRSLVVQTDAT